MTHHFFYELSLWLWEINLLSSVILQVYSNFSYMIDLEMKSLSFFLQKRLILKHSEPQDSILC